MQRSKFKSLYLPVRTVTEMLQKGHTDGHKANLYVTSDLYMEKLPIYLITIE